jgi:hypothetical protein
MNRVLIKASEIANLKLADESDESDLRPEGLAKYRDNDECYFPAAFNVGVL